MHAEAPSPNQLWTLKRMLIAMPDEVAWSLWNEISITVAPRKRTLVRLSVRFVVLATSARGTSRVSTSVTSGRIIAQFHVLLLKMNTSVTNIHG